MDSFTAILTELFDAPKRPSEMLPGLATSLQESKESESTVPVENEGGYQGPWPKGFCTVA